MILVTGGTGFIGSHTVVELLYNNYDVVIVDNLINSKEIVIDKIAEICGKKPIFINADLLDYEKINTIFNNYKIDSVIHFAGLKAVGESNTIPLKYYENNISGTVNLLKIMTAHNVKKLVFSSSATVYGNNNISPLTEDMPLSATNPYGRTKLFIEQILNDLFNSDNGWSISILRYFNPIGAHKSGLIGEDPNDIPNNIMPVIASVATGKIKYLSIFGNDYPTLDGTCIRDYIHVVDLANGHIKALEHNLLKSGISTYNLGTGSGYSVLELIKAFEKASGKKIEYKITERRLGDIAVCFSNPTKAKAELNWTANKTIDEMCEDSWRWQSNNPNGYIKNN